MSRPKRKASERVVSYAELHEGVDDSEDEESEAEEISRPSSKVQKSQKTGRQKGSAKKPKGNTETTPTTKAADSGTCHRCGKQATTVCDKEVLQHCGRKICQTCIIDQCSVCNVAGGKCCQQTPEDGFYDTCASDGNRRVCEGCFDDDAHTSGGCPECDSARADGRHSFMYHPDMDMDNDYDDSHDAWVSSGTVKNTKKENQKDKKEKKIPFADRRAPPGSVKTAKAKGKKYTVNFDVTFDLGDWYNMKEDMIEIDYEEWQIKPKEKIWNVGNKAIKKKRAKGKAGTGLASLDEAEKRAKEKVQELLKELGFVSKKEKAPKPQVKEHLTEQCLPIYTVSCLPKDELVDPQALSELYDGTFEGTYFVSQPEKGGSYQCLDFLTRTVFFSLPPSSPSF